MGNRLLDAFLALVEVGLTRAQPEGDGQFVPDEIFAISSGRGADHLRLCLKHKKFMILASRRGFEPLLVP